MPISPDHSIPQVFAPGRPANLTNPKVFQAIFGHPKPAPYKTT